MEDHKRTEYRLTRSGGKVETVWAHEISVTQNGDLVFGTVEQTGFADERGQPTYFKHVGLICASGQWENVETITNGSPLWKQSGKIKAA